MIIIFSPPPLSALLGVSILPTVSYDSAFLHILYAPPCQPRLSFALPPQVTFFRLIFFFQIRHWYVTTRGASAWKLLSRSQNFSVRLLLVVSPPELVSPLKNEALLSPKIPLLGFV